MKKSEKKLLKVLEGLPKPNYYGTYMWTDPISNDKLRSISPLCDEETIKVLEVLINRGRVGIAIIKGNICYRTIESELYEGERFERVLFNELVVSSSDVNWYGGDIAIILGGIRYLINRYGFVYDGQLYTGYFTLTQMKKITGLSTNKIDKLLSKMVKKRILVQVNELKPNKLNLYGWYRING